MRTRRLVLAAVAWVPLAVVAAEPEAARGEARVAFARGDYEAMAKAYEPLAAWALGQLDAAANDPGRLASLAREHLDDFLGLGHAHQLHGDWAAAVAAYQTALQVIEGALKSGATEPSRFRARGDGFDQQHARLACLIGCIQRDQLKDPAAAAATFARAVDFCPALKASMDDLINQYLVRLGGFINSRQAPRDFDFEMATRYPCQALRELAVTQERLGQLQAAIESWTKLGLFRPFFQGGGVLGSDIAALGALVQRVPAGQPLPRLPMLIVLSPLAPTATLKTSDPETLLRSCAWWGSGDADYWRFAFSPSPRQEFETLEFACDLEQTNPRWGGQFRCWTSATGENSGGVHLGSIHWAGNEPGREVIEKTVEVPPGAGVVSIEIGVAPGKFKVHGVTVKARFRPWEELATRTQPVKPKADVWMQTECLPPNGTLTRNGERIEPGTATSGMRPGRYAITYEVADHPAKFQCELDFVPGGKYGLFVNLDSPFRWQPTALRGFGPNPPSRASLIRLPDGRWLAAWGSIGSKVLLSASADGASWEKPWPLPHNPFAAGIEPSLHLDRKGTVWLTWFDNRLDWPSVSTGGYQLWLASSRDGREWSRSRPILLASEGGRRTFWREFGASWGWPYGAAELVEGPDGRHWLFWCGRFASAASPAELSELRPMEFEGGKPADANSHVSIDSAGRLHMVLLSSKEGLSYSTSADGRQWSAPVALPVDVPGTKITDGQLILDGAHAALLVETLNGGWFCRGTLGAKPQFGPPVKFTNHVVPLYGSRACLTPDGRVALLAGQDTVWLLWAERNLLTRPVHEF